MLLANPGRNVKKAMTNGICGTEKDKCAGCICQNTLALSVWIRPAMRSAEFTCSAEQPPGGCDCRGKPLIRADTGLGAGNHRQFESDSNLVRHGG